MTQVTHFRRPHFQRTMRSSEFVHAILLQWLRLLVLFALQLFHADSSLCKEL